MTDITFFAWGDPHFGYKQKFSDNDLRGRIIRQMNELPAWPYPKNIGGTVKRPEFVVCCGDMVDGVSGQNEYELDAYKYFCNKLKFKQYEVMGNHDLNRTFLKFFIEKHGWKSYSFNVQNIHFISLNSEYDKNEVGYISQEDLDWLENDLKYLCPKCKIVIFIHTRIDSLQNPGQLMERLNNNVILMLSAHKHKPEVFKYENINCISLGHCRNHPIDAEYGRLFYVLNISEKKSNSSAVALGLGELGLQSVR